MMPVETRLKTETLFTANLTSVLILNTRDTSKIPIITDLTGTVKYGGIRIVIEPIPNGSQPFIANIP